MEAKYLKSKNSSALFLWRALIFTVLYMIIGVCINVQGQTISEGYISTGEAYNRYKSLLNDKSFFVIPELRENPLRWYDSIPANRFQGNIYSESFNLEALPGEYYVYQLGIWAIKGDIDDVEIEFSDLKSNNKKIITSDRMTCFNKGGNNFKGETFTKSISIAAGRVQTLWIGIDLENIEEGEYFGSVVVKASDEKQVIPLYINVLQGIVKDHGYNKGKNLSRLNWLNSTVGIDDSITKEYLPLNFEENKISILGRTLQISDNGLPASIDSYFAPSNQSLVENSAPIINGPFRFIIEKEDGELVRLQPGELKIVSKSPSKIVWNVENSSDEFILDCTGQMEFDGFVGYKLQLKSKITTQIKDIRLEIPVNKDKAEYMMGLNHEGGYRFPNWKWKWDTTKHQDRLWIGSVNGGMQIKWKAENYIRPMVNVYYKYRNLNLPPSWGNEGKGGVDVIEENKDVVVKAYSGTRQMMSSDILNFDFELLITPFKIIDKKIKYGDCYFHSGRKESITMAKEIGANIINVHHANIIAPFINYPYHDENVESLKQFVSDAHDENILVKVYYTARELSVRIPEIWAFHSLQGEVIFPGPGPAAQRIYQSDLEDDWLEKNLREKYIPAWASGLRGGKFDGLRDHSIITTPDSRLNNFYISGLDWMVRNIHIDGVYIDDTHLDRFTLRRARKVLDLNRPRGKIDLHAPNSFTRWGGFGFNNTLNEYMEILPYIDLIWIGEGRDYNRAPDHWLIEVSGIPFGIAGQMLQDGGNQWRGMVYGITNRPPYKPSASNIWVFWDEHQIEKMEMTGYWQEDCPVKCYNPMIKGTVYKGEDKSLIAIANWSRDEQPVFIEIDYRKLGYDPANCDISIPGIKDFQDKNSSFDLSNMIIPGGKGFIFLIENKN